MRRRYLKIYKKFPYFVPYCAPKCFLPSLVEIVPVVLEKKSFKGKSWRWTDTAPWHELSWPSARWAKHASFYLSINCLKVKPNKKQAVINIISVMCVTCRQVRVEDRYINKLPVISVFKIRGKNFSTVVHRLVCSASV